MTTQQRVAQMLRRRPIRVHVAVNGTWSAELHDGSTIYTYEAIDLDKGCREFLEDLVSVGVEVVDYGNHNLFNYVYCIGYVANGGLDRPRGSSGLSASYEILCAHCAREEELTEADRIQPSNGNCSRCSTAWHRVHDETRALFV